MAVMALWMRAGPLRSAAPRALRGSPRACLRGQEYPQLDPDMVGRFDLRRQFRAGSEMTPKFLRPAKRQIAAGASTSSAICLRSGQRDESIGRPKLHAIFDGRDPVPVAHRPVAAVAAAIWHRPACRLEPGGAARGWWWRCVGGGGGRLAGAGGEDRDAAIATLRLKAIGWLGFLVVSGSCRSAPASALRRKPDRPRSAQP